VLLEVSVSVFLPATVAAVITVAFITINELLFGEGEELVRLDEVGAFERRDCGESPAGTALSLVFDLIDSAKVSPVFRFDFDTGGGHEWAIDVTVFECEDRKILLFSPISKFVEAELERRFSHVVLLDSFVVTDELGETVSVLSQVVVSLAELGDIGEESTFVLVESDSRGN